MHDYIIAFDVEGEAWTETDQHEGPDIAKAYAHVRIQMVLAERKPHRASATVTTGGGAGLGGWTYDAELGDVVAWTAEA